MIAHFAEFIYQQYHLVEKVFNILKTPVRPTTLRKTIGYSQIAAACIKKLMP